jgi:hypothetical protein
VSDEIAAAVVAAMVVAMAVVSVTAVISPFLFLQRI